MAKSKGGMIHGPESYGPDYLGDDDLDPASDAEQAQAHADRITFATSMSMLTGGEQHDLGKGVGPVVGTPYDDDPMGEERTMVTYHGDRRGSRGDGASNEHKIGTTPKQKHMVSGGVTTVMTGKKK